MKRVPLFLLILVVVTSMTWVAGCRSPEAPPSGTNDLMTREEATDFNDAYGGYNMKDEPEAFGDVSILEEFADDVDFADPIAELDDVANRERAEKGRLFLMITWGNLHRDSTIEDWTDWSGSLKVDPGIILLKKTIRFDARDRILPRTQRDLLEWESYTLPAIDGILVRILPTPAITAADSSIDSSNVVIKFDTAPLSVEFTLDQLPGLNRTITLDDGNAVSFMAVRVTPTDCPHGFLRGVWLDVPNRPGGIFFGKWATENGRIMGHLKGVYGVNDAGKKVFFGKIVDRKGRFEGIMRGEWGHSPAVAVDQAHGWFRGHWVDRNLQIKGGLKGEWGQSNRCHGGFFRGGWAKDCN